MAPPVSRRPGFSRRAQFGLFMGYVIAVLAVLVAVLLLVTARIDPKAHNALRSLLGDVASPISGGGRGVVRGVSGAGANIAAYINAASRVRGLEAEAKANRTRLMTAAALEHENVRLRALLHIAETTHGPSIAARIISSTGADSRRYAMIDKGSLHGIEDGEPVRAPDGLVGQVVQTGAFSARVLLISDSGAVVPVKGARDGVAAFVSGTGDGLLTVHPLVAGLNPFHIGDVLLTSGTGGVYSPDIPVAVVIGQDRDGLRARPLADPAALDFALVSKPFVAPLPAPVEVTTKVRKKKKSADSE